MPAHLLPLAIVVAKIGASAVVSLAPVAMSREEDESGQVVEERRQLRDFFKKEFYTKEFARLENERLQQRESHDRNEPPTPKKSPRAPASSSSRGFRMREFASLQNERGVSRRRVQRE